MARLYADENFPWPVVEELAKLGHDVLTISQDGKANQRYPVCSYVADFAGQAARIDAAIRTLDSLAGQLIRVNRPG